MKIELINSSLFDKFWHDQYEIVSTESAFNEHNKYVQGESLDYKRLVKIINEDKRILLPDIDKTIPVIFYSFSVWTRIKTRSNVFIQEPSLKTFFGKLTTSYQSGTESIYISRNLYEAKKKDKGINEHEVFKALLASDCSHEEATNLVLLHELGHAVHHQVSKQRGNLLDETTTEAKFLNKLMTTTDFVSSRKFDIPEISPVAYKAVTEGFADLYSCIVVDKLYGKEQATKIIEALHQMRLSAYELDEHRNRERYYSFDSIKHYIDNRDILSFNTFDDIHQYISDTVSKVAIHYINKEAGRYGNKSHCNFLGVINVVHNLNQSNAYAAALAIQKKFPFIDLYENKIKREEWKFQKGNDVGKEWLNRRSKRELKDKIRDTKKCIHSSNAKLTAKKNHYNKSN
ncbi:hypothetical protein [Citrobacter koseri]|uniref:hypothetical protein n=1 Tax=Citrobacter koseri TaxID=545 RepID=UPI003892C12C